MSWRTQTSISAGSLGAGLLASVAVHLALFAGLAVVNPGAEFANVTFGQPQLLIAAETSLTNIIQPPPAPVPQATPPEQPHEEQPKEPQQRPLNQDPEKPAPDEDTVRPGIDNTQSDSPNWLGFVEPTPHAGPLSTVEQSALTPRIGAPSPEGIVNPGTGSAGGAQQPPAPDQPPIPAQPQQKSHSATPTADTIPPSPLAPPDNQHKSLVTSPASHTQEQQQERKQTSALRELPHQDVSKEPSKETPNDTHRPQPRTVPLPPVQGDILGKAPFASDVSKLPDMQSASPPPPAPAPPIITSPPSGTQESLPVPPLQKPELSLQHNIIHPAATGKSHSLNPGDSQSTGKAPLGPSLPAAGRPAPNGIASPLLTTPAPLPAQPIGSSPQPASPSSPASPASPTTLTPPPELPQTPVTPQSTDSQDDAASNAELQHKPTPPAKSDIDTISERKEDNNSTRNDPPSPTDQPEHTTTFTGPLPEQQGDLAAKQSNPTSPAQPSVPFTPVEAGSSTPGPIAPRGVPRSGLGAGEEAEAMSDAAALETAIEIKPGKVMAGKGIQIRTVRPEWAITTRLRASPRNPVVKLTFGKSGRVIRASFVENQTTGDREVDGPLLDALYRWTARGETIDKLPTPRPNAYERGVTLSFRVLLRDEEEPIYP